MSTQVTFTIRKISTIDIPQPFSVVDLSASITFTVHRGGGSGPSWRILFEVRPVYPGASGTQGIIQTHVPLQANGDTWPPSTHIEGLDSRFHMRLWEDGRVALGCFQTTSAGERFFFGLGRTPVEVHSEEEIMGQRINHRLDNVAIDSWYEATSTSQHSKREVAHAVFRSADVKHSSCSQ
ncbi:hypothetical protein BDZ85DRAFT_48805 [Elsinoe ampelina]|uniref:Uncharacterized protein n=1 Tax=Elsinoe ampelina TaxID=302913 RepID=A0A6A6GKM4_9PEZI|nr:hypothetical protein BDZ85DRAFT_48805 [Elsinoe ampelina]